MREATAPVFRVGEIRFRLRRLRMLIRVVVVRVVRKARSVVVGFLRPMAVLAKRVMKRDVSQGQDIEPDDPQHSGDERPC